MAANLRELNEAELEQVAGGGILDNLLNSLLQGSTLAPVTGVVSQVTGVVSGLAGGLLGSNVNVKLGG